MANNRQERIKALDAKIAQVQQSIIQNRQPISDEEIAESAEVFGIVDDEESLKQLHNDLTEYAERREEELLAKLENLQTERNNILTNLSKPG